MTKAASETKAAAERPGHELYELCYIARDMSAELKSLAFFFGYAHEIPDMINGDDLYGFGVMLKRMSEQAAKIGKRLDEIAAPIEHAELKQDLADRFAAKTTMQQ
jgi:hypothetical protein